MDYKLKNLKRRNVANINHYSELEFGVIDEQFGIEPARSLANVAEDHKKKEKHERDSGTRSTSFGEYSYRSLLDGIRSGNFYHIQEDDVTEDVFDSDRLISCDINKLYWHDANNEEESHDRLDGRSVDETEMKDFGGPFDVVDSTKVNQSTDSVSILESRHDDQMYSGASKVVEGHSNHVSSSPTSTVPPSNSTHGFLPSCLKRLSSLPAAQPTNSQRNDMRRSDLINMQPVGASVHSLQHLKRDSFQNEVTRKTRNMLIGQRQAEIEVLMERLISEHRSKDAALMYVVTKVFPESKVLSLVTALLQRGALPTKNDADGCSPVFHAVTRGYVHVLWKLLDAGGLPHVKNKEGITPFHIALQKRNDDMAALLVGYMPNQCLQNLFKSISGKPADLSFHQLLQSKMKQTTLGVLDSFMDPTPEGSFKIHYHMLERDCHGYSPKESGYNKKTALHVIAFTHNKDAVSHDAVRLLILRKWNCFGRAGFIVNGILHLLSVLLLTFCLTVGINAEDPLKYDSTLQYIRACAEVYCSLVALCHLFVELVQMWQSPKDYCRDVFSWLKLTAVLSLLVVIPLRYTAISISWAVFGVGFSFWTMWSIKYAAITRSTGVFTHILWRILTNDIVQFMAIFIIILVAFTGLMVAGMKFEHPSGTLWGNTTFWSMLLTGTRTLVEQQPIMEYIDQGLGPYCVAVVIVFLFTILVVLLNILIARLSDTYQNIQRDAQRSLVMDRARIITQLERHPLFSRHCKKHYKHDDTVKSMHEKLKWTGNPPVAEQIRMLVDLQDKLEQQDLYLRTLGQRILTTHRSSNEMQVMVYEIHSILRNVLASDDRQHDYTSI